jgi:cysteine desulfurase
VQPIYLDYNATTPVDPCVAEAMACYFSEVYGNASSIDHVYGHDARQAVEMAREQAARLIDARSEEIVFTSGATEADNLAILGVMKRASDDSELIVSAVEHPAVLETAMTFGDRCRVVSVDNDGVVDPDQVARLLTRRTSLVSVMAANNETGAVQPVVEIGRVCREAGVLFHVDAAQAGARLKLDVDAIGADLLSLSAHKLYGPKGVGLLYVRRRERRVKLAPLMHGGGQERNLRPGTLNTPAIVGFGKAAELVEEKRKADVAREAELKEVLHAGLTKVGGVSVNGPRDTLPQTLNVELDGVGARALMHAAREELSFSSGSACATTKVEPSHALLAQGLTPEQAAQSIRLSFGRFTTEVEIVRAVDVLQRAVAELRRLTGFKAA